MERSFFYYIKLLCHRRQRKKSLFRVIRSGVKGAITIMILAAIGHYSEMPFIVAPFAATCITLYATPHIKFTQPPNVVGGYVVAAIVGVTAAKFFPHSWWIMGAIVFFTIAIMTLLRVTHPPAGSVPLVIYIYHSDKIGYDFVLFPILTGSVVIVALAIFLHMIPPRRNYPYIDPMEEED